jgi:hypothetical protein
LSIETGIPFEGLVNLDERVLVTYWDVLQERGEQMRAAQRKRRR